MPAARQPDQETAAPTAADGARARGAGQAPDAGRPRGAALAARSLGPAPPAPGPRPPSAELTAQLQVCAGRGHALGHRPLGCHLGAALRLVPRPQPPARFRWATLESRFLHRAPGSSIRGGAVSPEAGSLSRPWQLQRLPLWK